MSWDCLKAPAHCGTHESSHRCGANRSLLRLGCCRLCTISGQVLGVTQVALRVRMETTLLEEVNLFLCHLLHILIRLLKRGPSCLSLFKDLPRFLQEQFVFLNFLLVCSGIRRIKMLKLTHILPFNLVLHLELFLPDGFLLFSAHARLSIIPREHSPLLLYLLLCLIPHLSLDWKAQQSDSISDEVFLNSEVKWRVGREGGRVVDL